jgi:hypothetical protein
MDISPTQRVEAGPEGTGCEEKMRLFTPLEGGGAVWGSGHIFYLRVIFMSSYPLKPHGRSASFPGGVVHCLSALWLCLVVYSIMYMLLGGFFFQRVAGAGSLRTRHHLDPALSSN